MTKAPKYWSKAKNYLSKKDKIMSRYDKVSVEMNLGELLLFSGYLAHRSGKNLSNKHRYSLVGMYHD